MMLRFFNKAEQGFFYSFSGVIGLQVFLEAGFAQSVTQFTSREFAFLRWNSSGALKGSSQSLSKLRSLVQQANRYYRMMAGILVMLLSVGGCWFFSTRPSEGVPWLVPWLVASFAAGFNFMLTPLWAFIEGCNRVAELAIYRLSSTLLGFIITALGLVLNLGIHVVSLVAVANLLFAVVYIICRWRLLLVQVHRPVGKFSISWKDEVWSFQWRIALSWMSRYFLEAGIAPLAFVLGGPVLAGKTGMTFQIIRMIGSVTNTWTTTKIPSWGALAARGCWEELEKSWREAAKRNVAFTVIGLGAFVGGFPILAAFVPQVADRFLSANSLLCFALGWFFYSFWLVSMHYTRSLRKEPFMLLHMLVAILFLSGTCAVSAIDKEAAIPVVFALVHFPTIFLAFTIRRKTRESLKQAVALS
ncbi:MAG: hypothetical protein ACQKBU_05975 [Verrucomicrobiales bacterium]